MIIFLVAAGDGAGCTVTGANLVYRQALRGEDACYADFDLGVRGAGEVFGVSSAAHGTTEAGLHSYLQGACRDPHRVDVWQESDRWSPRKRPRRAGQLILVPGDQDGQEPAAIDGHAVQRLLRRWDDEFGLCVVHPGPGLSPSLEALLAAAVPHRILVAHRWTRRDLEATARFVARMDPGVVRFVRCAVFTPESAELTGLTGAQLAWIDERDRELHALAARLGMGQGRVAGVIPVDPVLRWRAQLITDDDVQATKVANEATVEAVEKLLTTALSDDRWNRL
ncbi:hypothetical protein J5X84_01740 [Streptosporangiaceae bacterium NEAU-GS5]|nr:hypothetical protein [Streptosporangiaceae bacterium NEAU-GS5]